MKERIKEILVCLNEIRKETKLAVDDNTLFSEALSCWRGEEAGKNRINPFRNEEKTKLEKKEDKTKPTDKQLNFFKKNRVKVPDNLTRIEATNLIKNYLNNLKEENI